MGHNVQSQAGVSVGDVYDVRGSQAPIERILTKDVQGTHDMASTVFSERVSGFVRNIVITGVLQSANFDLVIADLPAGVSRIVGVVVNTDNSARLANVAVSVEGGTRGMPIWVWNGNASTTVRFLDGTVIDAELLPTIAAFNAWMHQMVIGDDQPQQMNRIALRGSTTAFGAGTVDITALISIEFAAIGGISARGLPIPSW